MTNVAALRGPSLNYRLGNTADNRSTWVKALAIDPNLVRTSENGSEVIIVRMRLSEGFELA